jgi:hypothetical protein
MIVDFDGRILHQADPGPGEKIVAAEIDIEALREARRKRRGHNPLGHLRAELYGLDVSSGYPPSTHTSAGSPQGDRTIQDNLNAIAQALARPRPEAPPR